MSPFHHHHLPPKTTKLFSSPLREKSETKPKLPFFRLTLLILLCFATASFLKISSFSPRPPPLPAAVVAVAAAPPRACSSYIKHGPNISNTIKNLLCCDRSHFRTDVCYIAGDVRTAGGGGATILLAGASPENGTEEKIRPYTRKWEKEIMSTVNELTLRRSPALAAKRCEVRHVAPAVVFSTGGYTGNVFHEFNDGLIPLYITAARFAGEVVLVVVEYHEWWFVKYREILEKISNYEIVDLKKDKRVHCFGEMIVGLMIHGDLAIDSNLMHKGKTIHDFQSLLTAALTPTPSHPSPPPPLPSTAPHPLTLTILTRHHTRRLLNLPSILHLSLRTGFHASLLTPKRSTPLSHLHRSLSSSDAILAVHGAALTHLLFLRPGSVLIQIIPLGLDWAAETYYAEPARRLGLQYLPYNVTAAESSLSKEYGKTDPVLVNPKLVTKKGWAETKRVYMDKQDVELDLKRLGKVMQLAKARLVKYRSRKNSN